MNKYEESGLKELITSEIDDNILAILRGLPIREIPEEFNGRLSMALMEEGKNIRAGRAKGFWGRQNKHVKALAALAACLVVVFVSTAVYNDGKEEALPGVMPESTADAGMTVARGMEQKENEDFAVDNLSAGSKNHSVANVYGVEPEEENLADADEPEKKVLFQVKEDKKYEFSLYEGLIEELYRGYKYKYISREIDDEGNYLFTIKIISGPEGEAINSYLVLLGAQGEIHERRNKSEADNN